MGYPETFKGYAVFSKEKWSQPELYEYQPKTWEETDVDVEISACGVCASDIHTATSGWGATNYPIVVGHEIIGTAVRVGKDVKTIKVGDRVGVGAQVWACLSCKTCKNGGEQYCPNIVETYDMFYADGVKSMGGYASHVRAKEHFVFKIPDNLDTESAAPMLCAGITTYSPLVRNGAGPGKKVGILGMGGLGHFAIMWAHALGAEVYVISRTESKKADAIKLGAKHFIATSAENWWEPYERELDLIVNCANSAENFPLQKYLSLLDIGGKFVSVGLPEGDGFLVKPTTFIGNACFFGASNLGSRKEMIEMLQLASDKGLKGWTKPIPVSEAGVHEAMEKCHAGEARYRYTLVGFDKVFGSSHRL